VFVHGENVKVDEKFPCFPSPITIKGVTMDNEKRIIVQKTRVLQKPINRQIANNYSKKFKKKNEQKTTLF
jgi:hypothetical protein